MNRKEMRESLASRDSRDSRCSTDELLEDERDVELGPRGWQGRLLVCVPCTLLVLSALLIFYHLSGVQHLANTLLGVASTPPPPPISIATRAHGQSEAPYESPWHHTRNATAFKLKRNAKQDQRRSKGGVMAGHGARAILDATARKAAVIEETGTGARAALDSRGSSTRPPDGPGQRQPLLKPTPQQEEYRGRGARLALDDVVVRASAHSRSTPTRIYLP